RPEPEASEPRRGELIRVVKLGTNFFVVEHRQRLRRKLGGRMSAATKRRAKTIREIEYEFFRKRAPKMTREFLKTRKGPGINFVSLLALAHKEMEEFSLPRHPKERPFHSNKSLPLLPGKPLEIPIRRKG
ncbi:MAG: hypothetical protein ABIJ85_05020, partial [bacterium]